MERCGDGCFKMGTMQGRSNDAESNKRDFYMRGREWVASCPIFYDSSKKQSTINNK